MYEEKSLIHSNKAVCNYFFNEVICYRIEYIDLIVDTYSMLHYFVLILDKWNECHTIFNMYKHVQV